MHHEEAEGLLPWLVNGTLADDERSRVAQHIEECEACRNAVADLSSLQASVRREPATPIVPEPDVTALMKQLDSRDSSRKSKPMWLAAAAAIVSLAAILFTLQSNEPTSAVFRTTTSPADRPAMDYVLDIRFGSGSDVAARSLLESFEATVIDYNSAESAYRVVVNLELASMDALEEYRQSIEAMESVANVNIVAIHPPGSPDP